MCLGVFASLSLMDNTPFTVGGKTVFDGLDFLSSNILLPLGGLLIVIFVGWYLGKKKFYDEITNEGQLKMRIKPVILFIIKFVAPLAIAVIFVSGLGLFK